MPEYFHNGFLIEVEPEIEEPPSWGIRLLILMLVIILYPVALALLVWDRFRAK